MSGPFVTAFTRYIHCRNTNLFFVDVGVPKVKTTVTEAPKEPPAPTQNGSSAVVESTELETKKKRKKRKKTKKPQEPCFPTYFNRKVIESLTEAEVTACMDIAKRSAVQGNLVRKDELFKIIVTMLRYTKLEIGKETKEKSPKKDKEARKEERDEQKKLLEADPAKKKAHEELVAAGKVINDKLNLIYMALDELTASFHDFTLFLRTYRKFQVESQQNRGYGRALRRFVQRWYMNKSEDELCTMLSQNRTLHGMNHGSILKLCHPFRKEVTQEDSVEAKETEELRSKLKIVLNFMSSSSKKFKESKETSFENEENFTKLVTNIRTTTNITEVCQKLISGEIKMKNLADVHLKHYTVWETLLKPNVELPYEKLLENMYKLRESNFLAASKEVAKLCVDKLQNTQLLATANVHPFALYLLHHFFIQKSRYFEHKKEEEFEKRYHRKHISVADEVNTALYSAFNNSFEHYKVPKLNYVIMIDTRKQMKNKKIFSKHISTITVLDCSLIIALTFIKHGESCLVLTYDNNTEPSGDTPNAARVAELPFNASMTFDEVKTYCTSNLKNKVTRKFSSPLDYVKTKYPSRSVDVFISITDGVCNIMDGKGTAALDTFTTAETNGGGGGGGKAHPKYIAMGLCRRQRDLHGTDERILEIAGFTVDTAKVMETFIKTTAFVAPPNDA